jgi:hypothetical protein
MATAPQKSSFIMVPFERLEGPDVMLLHCSFWSEQRWHKKDIINCTLDHVSDTDSLDRKDELCYE